MSRRSSTPPSRCSPTSVTTGSTMDAVATRAKASKATLYRRWTDKLTLVIDALVAQKAAPEPPDTGSLRGDLAAAYCGFGGLTDRHTVSRFTSVLTAISRDPEFAEAYRTAGARAEGRRSPWRSSSGPGTAASCATTSTSP